MKVVSVLAVCAVSVLASGVYAYHINLYNATPFKVYITGKTTGAIKPDTKEVSPNSTIEIKTPAAACISGMKAEFEHPTTKARTLVWEGKFDDKNQGCRNVNAVVGCEPIIEAEKMTGVGTAGYLGGVKYVLKKFQMYVVGDAGDVHKSAVIIDFD
jgi:hypothetical protein